MDLARQPGTSQFSPQWLGPPPDRLLPWGQVAAMDVLNAALGFALRPDPTPSNMSVHNSAISDKIFSLIPFSTTVVNVLSSTPRFSLTTESDGETQTVRVPATSSPSDEQGHKPRNLPLIAGLITLASFFVGIPILVYYLHRRRQIRRSRTLGVSSSEHQSCGNTNATPGLDPYIVKNREPMPLSEKRASHRATMNLEKSAPSSSGIAPSMDNTSGTASQSSNARDDRTRTPENETQREGRNNDGPSMIPTLIDRLNRAIALLPVEGASTDAETEEPPEYTAM